MHTKAWRTELMGSEGWAVFMPNPKLPRFEIMIASNMSEEHARLIAAAPELLDALEEAMIVVALYKQDYPNTIQGIEASDKGYLAIRKAKGQ